MLNNCALHSASDQNILRWILEEQDKLSDIEQQPPFGDRKISNIQPQNRGGGYKTPIEGQSEGMIIMTLFCLERGLNMARHGV